MAIYALLGWWFSNMNQALLLRLFLLLSSDDREVLRNPVHSSGSSSLYIAKDKTISHDANTINTIDGQWREMAIRYIAQTMLAINTIHTTANNIQTYAYGHVAIMECESEWQCAPRHE